ncbi:MAG TPA: hypothetical protein VJW77_07625 [Terriglobia bacterium]|nr:hypothetical protein [Terriglobia bacterium]
MQPPQQKVKVNIPNVGQLEGTKVTIEESTERWSEIKLDDGSVLRVKPAIVSVIRIDGQYDPEGNPLYAIQGGHVMAVQSAPDHLKKDATKDKKVQ